jgi:hypothetical protein
VLHALGSAKTGRMSPIDSAPVRRGVHADTVARGPRQVRSRIGLGYGVSFRLGRPLVGGSAAGGLFLARAHACVWAWHGGPRRTKRRTTLGTHCGGFKSRLRPVPFLTTQPAATSRLRLYPPP